MDKRRDPETYQVLEDAQFFEDYPPPTKETLESDDPAVVFDFRGRLPVDW